MSTILLNDLLHLSKADIARAKIKFNQMAGDADKNDIGSDPMALFRRDPEIINTEWLFWKNEKKDRNPYSYFSVGQIAICFLKLDNDKWLLTTIKEVTKDLNVFGGVCYDGYEKSEYAQYFGRVIVEYHKRSSTQGFWLETIMDDLVVNQILPATFDGSDFPGYDSVRLSYSELELIVNRHKRDWVSALSNQKAVYLLTDINTGKLYVGSATADKGMLLQRWSSYVLNGHGGNKELIELVKDKGFDYVKKNFQYSILENYNAKTDDNYILKRESWWKDVLDSRKHGYNAN